MKKLSILAIIISIFCLSACSKDGDKSIKNSSGSEASSIQTQEWMHTDCSKEYVKEFMSILGNIKGEGLLSGVKFDEEHCFNVTPKQVSESTDIKIFKFSDSCVSLALIDDEVFEICESFGGYGFFNAVPWDYDEDGTMDLLIASSYGSGVHCSEISVFNVKTKQSIVICSSLEVEGDNSRSDWFVSTQTPSSYTGDPEEVPVFYVIYSARVNVEDNLADLSYVAKSFVGSVSIDNGKPVFIPYKKNKE